MYKKAMKFKDVTTAQQILNTASLERAKALGIRVNGFSNTTWKDVASDYMYSVMYAKFSQNPDPSCFSNTIWPNHSSRG